MSRERGFALLMVLWTMGLLALLVAQFATTGRTEVRVAANLRANAVAQAAADGALHEAILRLLQGAWGPDGHVRVLRVEDAAVNVRIRNQAWKVNPNVAPVSVIQALLVKLGVDPGKAATLARAIIDWRSAGSQSVSGGPKLAQYQATGLPYGPANQLYDSLDEIGLVVGMTPSLLARMKPLLSIYQEGDAPGPGDPLAAAREEDAPATEGDGWQLGSTGRIMVVMIEATAVAVKGGRFTRQAVVRLRAEASLDEAPYEILTWETPSE
jgi:general secretion pathway protein K